MMRRTTIFAFSLLGLFVSLYLLWVYTSPASLMVCLGGGTGCDTVRASRYAQLFGVPLPAYGVLMYAALALLIYVECLVSGRLANTARVTVTAISGVGFLFSVYLTAIEAFVVRAWCTWCLLSALCTTLIFGFSLWVLLRPGKEPDASQALFLARQHLAEFILAVAVGVPSFYVLLRSAPSPPPPAPSLVSLAQRLVRPDSHQIGNPDAAVTLVEFGDFQCAPCGRAEPVLREVRRRYGDRIRFVFRHFPLDKIHPQARKAAEASECAADQGKFWEAAAKFYEHQDDLSESGLERYAAELGLDQARFRQCLASGDKAARVQRDLDDARALGLRATPTFFVGTHMFEGVPELAVLKQLLNQQISDSAPVPVTQPAPAIPIAASPKRGDPVRPGDSQGLSAKTPSSPPAPLGRGGSFFGQFQNSTGVCSEEEAEIAIPVIETAAARRLFEAHPQPLFVDLRSEAEFAEKHIPNATNIPLSQLESRHSSLPKDRTIILYEKGNPTGDPCAANRTAARLLLRLGFSIEHIKAYDKGLIGWENAGLAVAR